MGTPWPQKPPLGSQIDWSNPINQGLVACWLMNEGSGNQIYDLSGNGNTGTILGAAPPVWQGGRFGPDLSFGGGAGYVSVPNSSTVNLSSVMTVSFWAKGPPSDGTYRQILSKINSGAGWQFQTLNDVGTTQLQFAIVNATPTLYSYLITGFLNSSYSHVAVCCNGSNATIYVNGKYRDILAYTGSFANTINVCIGSRGTPNRYWLGDIDNVQIWNRALAPAEVLELYKNPFGRIYRKNIQLWTPAFAKIDVTVSPDTMGTVLTLQTPATNYGSQISPSALALLLSQQTPTIKYDYRVSPAALALLLTQQTSGVNYDFKVSPAAQELALTLQDTTQEYDFVFSSSALSLVLTGQSPTLNYDYKLALGSALSLALNLETPITSIGFTVEPDTLALTVELQDVTINYDYLVNLAESLGLVCSIQPPSVNVAGGRTYIVCSSTSPATLDMYVGGVLVARFTESGVQTLGGVITSL